MLNEIIKYATGLNASDDVLKWIDTHLKSHIEKNEQPISQTEVEHIIDFLNSDKRPKRISKMSYEQALIATEKWNKALIKKGSSIKESPSDIEVIHDFQDGFKIVKLIGENAYKREGFLMRHCVASYYGKNKEIYSLRDKDNMPHCTMEKDQQIKGKGNGSIHPNYINYIVKFLELSGMKVGDNEMKNLGYVNVEKYKNDLDCSSLLFQKKYLFNGDFSKIDETKRNNIAFWSVFGLFEFNHKLQVKMNFDIKLCIQNLTKKLKLSKSHSSNNVAMRDFNDVAMEDYNRVAMEDYNEVAMKNSNRVAMQNSNKVAMRDFNDVAMEDYNRVAMEDYNEVAMKNSNRVAMKNHNEVAMRDFNDVAMEDYNRVAMKNYNRVAMKNHNEVAMKNYNKVAIEDNNDVAMQTRNKVAMRDSNDVAIRDDNEVAMQDYNRVAMQDHNKVAMQDYCLCVGNSFNELQIGSQTIAVLGNGSKAKGKIGSWIILYERDNYDNITNLVSVKIDGAKIKEDTFYALKDGKLREVTDEN